MLLEQFINSFWFSPLNLVYKIQYVLVSRIPIRCIYESDNPSTTKHAQKRKFLAGRRARCSRQSHKVAKQVKLCGHTIWGRRDKSVVTLLSFSPRESYSSTLRRQHGVIYSVLVSSSSSWNHLVDYFCSLDGREKDDSNIPSQGARLEVWRSGDSLDRTTFGGKCKVRIF